MPPNRLPAGPAPRPAADTDHAGFVVALGDLRTWAGLSLQALAGKNELLRRSTISRRLRVADLPDWLFVTAFVTVCLAHRGYTEQQIAGELACWQVAYRQARRLRLDPSLPNDRSGQAQTAEPAGAVSLFAPVIIHTTTTERGGLGPRRRLLAVWTVTGLIMLVVGGSYMLVGRASSSPGCGRTINGEEPTYAYWFHPCWGGATGSLWFVDRKGDGMCVLATITFQMRDGSTQPWTPKARACPHTDLAGRRLEVPSPPDSVGATVSFHLDPARIPQSTPSPTATPRHS